MLPTRVELVRHMKGSKGNAQGSLCHRSTGYGSKWTHPPAAPLGT